MINQKLMARANQTRAQNRDGTELEERSVRILREESPNMQLNSFASISRTWQPLLSVGFGSAPGFLTILQKRRFFIQSRHENQSSRLTQGHLRIAAAIHVAI